MDRRQFLVSSGSIAAGLCGCRRMHAAEASGLKPGPIRRVSADGAKYFEPWIAANPRDASNLLIVGSRYLADPDAGPSDRMEPAAWFTADGGATWSPGAFADSAELRGKEKYFADAHATYAPDGTAFCVFGGTIKSGSLRMRDIDLWVYRSTDGGRNWQGPTRVTGGGFDYPRLAANMTNGQPRVFVAAAVDGDAEIFGASKRSGYGCTILRSDDGAKSFSVVNFLAPTTLHHDPINSPVVLPDGRLLVGVADYPADPSEKGPRGDVTHGRTYAFVSRDGGATFSTPVPVCDHLVQDGFVDLAADQSAGARRGRIYAVRYSLSSRSPGLAVQSSDDAAVWTAPVAVPNVRQGSIPLAAAAVSSRGVLGVAWTQGPPGDEIRIFDREWSSREHPWDLYFSTTADGGTSFTGPAPVHITSSRTCPTKSGRPYGTDYIAIATPPDGSFHIVWIETQGGTRQIQTVKIS